MILKRLTSKGYRPNSAQSFLPLCRCRNINNNADNADNADEDDNATYTQENLIELFKGQVLDGNSIENIKEQFQNLSGWLIHHVNPGGAHFMAKELTAEDLKPIEVNEVNILINFLGGLKNFKQKYKDSIKKNINKSSNS